VRRIVVLVCVCILLISVLRFQRIPAAYTAPIVEPETAAPTEIETQPVLEGELLLSVASIDFSVVGESEDICVGTADREYILWESADESVIAVDNGVLTAVGVGSTTVTATYGDQTVQCTAGCLAETEEELYLLGEEVIRAPKRIPPVYENPPLEFFDDAALIGDSITYIMCKYEMSEGILGHPTFLTRSGTGLCGLLYRYSNIVYRGEEIFVEDAVAATDSKKLFVMLGQNDLGWRSVEDTFADWQVFVDRIREKQPDAEFYIQSVIYEWNPTHIHNPRNDNIAIFNEKVIQFCRDNGHHYVDIQKYVEDHTGRMASPYNLDDMLHLNLEGCVMWMHVLNNYAYLQTIGANP